MSSTPGQDDDEMEDLPGLEEITNEKKTSFDLSLSNICSGLSKIVSVYGRKLAVSTLQYSWIISTSTVFVLMPILFELRREEEVKEMEKLQVAEMLKQGYPPKMLKEAGFEFEPSVLASTEGEKK